jgi:hypothetical protein
MSIPAPRRPVPSLRPLCLHMHIERLLARGLNMDRKKNSTNLSSGWSPPAIGCFVVGRNLRPNQGLQPASLLPNGVVGQGFPSSHCLSLHHAADRITRKTRYFYRHSPASPSPLSSRAREPPYHGQGPAVEVKKGSLSPLCHAAICDANAAMNNFQPSRCAQGPGSKAARGLLAESAGLQPSPHLRRAAVELLQGITT